MWTCARIVLAAGAALVFAGPVGAGPIDLSLQPDLKAWSNIIPDPTRRFVVLADFENGAGPGRRAVLDRETGLVWEQTPQITNHTWFDARAQCANKNVGGRKGWRLSSVVELGSLIDPAGVVLALPPGHPFVNIQPGSYWSATTSAENPAQAWYVVWNTGNMSTIEKTFSFRLRLVCPWWHECRSVLTQAPRLVSESRTLQRGRPCAKRPQRLP